MDFVDVLGSDQAYRFRRSAAWAAAIMDEETEGSEFRAGSTNSFQGSTGELGRCAKVTRAVCLGIDTLVAVHVAMRICRVRQGSVCMYDNWSSRALNI